MEPAGGVDERKYSAIALALGVARGAIYSAIEGNIEEAKRLLELTATHCVGTALGYAEEELTIDWSDHLSNEEINRIKGN